MTKIYVYENISTKNNDFRLDGPSDSSGPWTRYISIESQKGRKCIEFSWDKNGALYFLIGFVISDSSFYYYHSNYEPCFIEYDYPIHIEINRTAIGLDSLGEEVMICGNTNENSIIVVNKNTQYKYIEKRQGTHGNMRITMGQGKSSYSVDNLHVKYRESNFTNKMPLGFSAWEYCRKTNIPPDKRILNVALLLIFVCVCSSA